MESGKNQEDNSNEVSDATEDSDSSNGVNERTVNLFKSISRLIQVNIYSFAYFTMSAILLNKIFSRFLPKLGLNFKWNIYNFIQK